MAVLTKSREALFTYYDNYTYEFVDRFNYAVQMLNLMSAHLSTGTLVTGSITVTFNGTPQTITQNFNTGLGTGSHNAFLDISNWSFYFSSNDSIVTVTSFASSVELTADVGYIYIGSDGSPVVVSAPYSTYQPDKVRLLRFEKNSLGYYSIIVMPELAGTPKYLRSISQSQPLLHVKSFSYSLNLLEINRLDTKCLTEGAGCFSASDSSVLDFSDASPVSLVDEGSNVEYTDLDVSGTAGTFITKQLWLTYDGKLVVQPGTTSYTSLEEAIVELPYEYFPIINGDSVGEFVPVLRIAHEVSATDLGDTSQAHVINLTELYSAQVPPVWYTK